MQIRVVNCNFHASNPASTSVQVATTDFPFSDRIAEQAGMLSKMLDEGAPDPYSCGGDINGKSHEGLSSCDNIGGDDFEEPDCLIDRLRGTGYLRDLYEWMPSLLECYWQHGVDAKALAVLDGMGFVQWYS